MKQSLLFRPRSRIITALLAAWMTVFAVAEVVHTHGPLAPATNQSSLSQPSVGGSQRGTCLACLASHDPAPAADVALVVTAPQDAEAILLVEYEGSLRCALFPTLPSRAPPTHSTTQA